jgi:hypothetical protein
MAVGYNVKILHGNAASPRIEAVRKEWAATRADAMGLAQMAGDVAEEASDAMPASADPTGCWMGGSMHNQGLGTLLIVFRMRETI